MKQKNKIIYFFLFLLVLPLSYGLTLDELIASYDYSYSSLEMDVASVAHYGNDTGGSPLYDYMIVNLTVDNLEGNYTFIGDLYRDGGLITTISDTYYLLAGQNVVPLYYEAKLLGSGAYNLSLMVQEDYLTVYSDYVYSFDFDNTLYEKPEVIVEIDSYELVNTDGDGKYEILRVNANVTSNVSDTFEINALMGNGKTINSKKNYTLVEGLNSISIDFDGREIRRERINDSKLYLITLGTGAGYVFDFNYPLVYDLYDFDAEQSVLGDSYSDGKVDLNSNNLSEFLEINISLDINESGTYSIEMELEDLYDNYVKKVSEEFILGIGEQNVSFRINGTSIYNSKLNGPYLLEYIKLSKGGVTLDYVSGPYITNSYNYDEFERNLMPDLIITSLEVIDGTINMNVTNSGEGYAFAFNVELFDDNFSSLKESSVDYLTPGGSKELSYDVNISDIPKLYAVIDYDGIIEERNESNNLFVKQLIFSFDINLTKGWNLISIPLNLTNTTLPIPFESIEGNYSHGFTFIDGEWYSYYAGEPPGEKTIEPTMAIWINMTNDDILELEGAELNLVDLPLSSGLNLVGYPYLEEKNVAELFENDTVYSYNGTWSSYIPDRLFNSLEIAKPGYGYWVKVE